MITDSAGSRLGQALNLAGVAVVGYYFALTLPQHAPLWILISCWIGLLAWLLTVVLPRRLPGMFAVLVVMIAVGAAVSASTQGVAIAIVVIALIRVIADPSRRLWHGLLLAAVAAAVIPFGVFVEPTSALGLAALEGGVALGVLIGVNRRQSRTAEAQARLLLEERIANREDQARGAALAERQAVARDIHDVLAHSLGGLVISSTQWTPCWTPGGSRMRRRAPVTPESWPCPGWRRPAVPSAHCVSRGTPWSPASSSRGRSRAWSPCTGLSGVVSISGRRERREHCPPTGRMRCAGRCRRL